MRDRSFGVTTLAFSSIMVALYSQLAAIALLLMGSVFTAAGSMHGAVTLITGAVFLGLTVAAYFVGFGFWTRKHWSWAGGVILFAALIGASVFLAIISANMLSAVLPATGAVIAVAYMQRPAVRAELLGDDVESRASIGVADRMDVPNPAH